MDKDQLYFLNDIGEQKPKSIHKSCNSYNLFFYHIHGKIICKVVPRFVVSPLYVGYKIPQVSTKLNKVKEQLINYFKTNNGGNYNEL